MKKRAVAYLRISSARQIDNESPDTQRAAIQSYANANNIEIVEWFFDEAKSGKNSEREELQKLLKYTLKHKSEIDYVIVYKMSRASRNLADYIQQVKLVLQSRGIGVRSATESGINESPTGQLLEGMMVLLAQFDNDNKAEYTVDNMKSLALQGYWQHPPKLGYDSHKVPNEQGKLRPSMRPNDKAELVKKVLERFSHGDITKAELAKFAKDIGLKSINNKNLSKDSINRLLKSPEYAGYVHDKFTDYELVEGKHDPIISKLTYEKNQKLLYGDSSRKGQVHRKINPMYPLKGLIKCINCEKNLYASAPTKGAGTPSPRYDCTRKSCTGKVKSVKADVVHDTFQCLLRDITPSDGVLKLYKTILVRESAKELGSLNRKVKATREKKGELEKTRLKTIKEFIDGNITQQEKSDLVDDIDKQKLAISSELDDLEQNQQIREADIEACVNFMLQVDKQWQVASIEVKQKFQSMLFPDGLIYDPNKNSFGTKQISPLYRYAQIEKSPEGLSESDLVAGAGFEPATLWL